MSVEVLREVRLYGALGREFGRLHILAVRSAAEAVRALCAVLPGFERAFLGRPGQPVNRYHVFVGRGRQRESIGVDDATETLGRADPVRIVPVIEGAKRGGILQTIVGVALIVVGVVYGGPFGAGLIKIGAAMALSGVVQFLTPVRTADNSAKPDNLPSYGFDNGPVNTTQEGLPVPLAFGRVVIGSAQVSGGLSTDEIVIPAGTGGSLTPPPRPPYQPIDPSDSLDGGAGKGG